MLGCLGQFCAKVITLSLYRCTKRSCRVMKKISIKFHQEALTSNNFFGDILGITIKLENAGSTFSTFNPSPSLPSAAKDDRRHFQLVNIVLNNKNWTIIFEIWLIRRHVLTFYNREFKIQQRRRRRKRHLKSDLTFFETAAQLSQLAHFVQWRQTFLDLNS